MNRDSEPDPELRPELQQLIVDVLEGCVAPDDERVQAAMAAEPEFAAFLRGSLQMREHLVAYHDAEKEALRAPPSELEDVANAAMRSHIDRSRPATPSPSRRWFLVALAAVLVVAFAVFAELQHDGGIPDAPGTRLGPHDVTIRFEGSALLLAPEPRRGQSYRVEFGTGDQVILTRRTETARLSMPDLRRYLPDLWVHAHLIEVGEILRDSDRLPVPPDSWR